MRRGCYVDEDARNCGADDNSQDNQPYSRHLFNHWEKSFVLGHISLKKSRRLCGRGISGLRPEGFYLVPQLLVLVLKHLERCYRLGVAGAQLLKFLCKLFVCETHLVVKCGCLQRRTFGRGCRVLVFRPEGRNCLCPGSSLLLQRCNLGGKRLGLQRQLCIVLSQLLPLCFESCQLCL